MSLPIVAIVGAPNSGKSTLFNRLLGRRKALVHREAGMTRDVNEATCDWDGRQVLLLDTGGLTAPGDLPLEGRMLERVAAAASGADVLIFLVDGRTGLSPVEEDLGRLFHRIGRPVILAVNKLDVPGRDYSAADFHKLGFPSVVPLSAEHNLGIELLLDAVRGALPVSEAEHEALPEDTGEAEGEASLENRPAGEVRIAIAGRPNVGKSSLLNALMGEDRVLVSEVPGTTRDAIDCLLRTGDRTYRIIDTAGIRRKGRVGAGAEALSVMSAQRSIIGADVVLVLMDCTESPTLQDLHVAGIAQQESRPFAVLLNKWDLLGTGQAEESGSGRSLIASVRQRLKFAPYAPILSISARTGLHVNRIFPLVQEIHAQAIRRLNTGKLNAWLRQAVAAHRPPAARGKDFKIYYVAQKASNPPAFVAFTNSSVPPHFSYQRYLENSIRARFGLDRTPVILRYRQRPRTGRPSRSSAGRSSKRTV
jgi:GTP-binding protein